MTVADVLLVALGAVALGAGVRVVATAHLVRAGLHLVLCLGAIAGIYLVLGAEFVAWVQVLIYLGAVVVLLLFAVMLTRAPIGASTDLDRPGWPAALVGGGTAVGLTLLLVDAFRWVRVERAEPGTAERLGAQLFGTWVLPFEVLSILLLAALVGAIVLSRPDIGAAPDAAAGVGPAAPSTTGGPSTTGAGGPAAAAAAGNAPPTGSPPAVADRSGTAPTAGPGSV